jgi:dTDP-glucose 4,6-dehydratase
VDNLWKTEKNMKKRVLLTGAGGAIGIHVLRYLIEHTEWDVVCLDSFRHKGYFDRITEFFPEGHPRIQMVVHDLVAPLTERQIRTIGRIDYVLNLAARSDVQASIEDPISFVKNNTDLMLNVLEYARAAKPRVFLHFSTDEVYGPAPKDSGGHKEWDAIIPSNPYSASKACQEALAIAWWRSYNVPLILTNTMNNFGETQAPSKFPSMIQKKLQSAERIPVHTASNGEVGTRYYIHSRETASAILFILLNVEPTLHRYGNIDMPVRLNIVGEKQVSNLDMVETIAGLMGKVPAVEMVNYHENNPGHDIHYGLNGDKLKSLGWTPRESFEDGMKRTIEWQRTHPEWMTTQL